MTARPDAERVQRTLAHVARYRMTTPEALRTVPPLRLATNAAALDLLRTLVADGRLGEAPLDRHRPYFFLAERGAREAIGTQSRLRFGPLSELAKLRNFALLAFCRLSSSERERLSPADLRRLLPGLDTGGMSASFYAERSESARTLGFARVDVGGLGRWDRVVATVLADARRLIGEPGLKPLVRGGSFEITLITATPEKAERIRPLLPEAAAPPIPIRVIAIPRLLTVVGSARAPPRP